MRKLSVLFLIATLTSLLLSCSTIQQFKARTLLMKCEYSFKSVSLKSAGFSPNIFVKGKKIKLTEFSKDLLTHSGDILSGNFDLDLTQLELELAIEVKNPHDQYVLIDSVISQAIFDNGYALDIEHLSSTKIPAKSKQDIHLDLAFPMNAEALESYKSDSIQVKGQAYAKINFGKFAEKSIPVPIDMKEEIPKDMMLQAIKEEKDKYLRKAEKLMKSGAKSIMNLFN